MGNDIIQIVTQPSWVEYAMFVVTTLYLFATIGVFLANRKMAKAAEDQIKTATRMAELSKNVELFDKRIALVKSLPSKYGWQIYNNSNLRMEISILFPSEEVHDLFEELIMCIVTASEYEADLSEYTKNSNVFSFNFELLVSEIEQALENPKDKEEVDRLRSLASQYVLIDKREETREKELNLFDILDSNLTISKEIERIKEQLLQSMTALIHNSLSVSISKK